MLRELTLSANVSAPRMIGFPAPAQLNVIVLHAVRSPLISLKVKDVAKADDMHGAFAAVLAVFRISRVIPSMPILPLWVMPSLVVASNHPFTPCKNGMAIIAATIPNSVITIIISMSVKPLLLFMGELPLHRKSPHLNPLSFRERARVRVGFRIYPQLQPNLLLNSLKLTKHFMIPKTQHTKARPHQPFCASFICFRIFCMLSAIYLKNQFPIYANKIKDKITKWMLTAELKPGHLFVA